MGHGEQEVAAVPGAEHPEAQSRRERRASGASDRARVRLDLLARGKLAPQALSAAAGNDARRLSRGRICFFHILHVLYALPLTRVLSSKYHSK